MIDQPKLENSMINQPRRGRPPLPEGDRATSVIVLRVHPKRKAAYVRAAKKGTLAGWMFSVCDEASGYRE